MSRKSDLLHDSILFQKNLGAFAIKWGMAELAVSFAIGKFLGQKYEETHLLTAGMPFAKKASLLRALIKRAKPQNASQILGALKILQDSNRNTLFHGYVLSTAATATFFETRINEGKFIVTAHPYTFEEFHEHVAKFYDGLGVFMKEVGARATKELKDFGYAAINLSSKSIEPL
jgi:hypothetical protein